MTQMKRLLILISATLMVVGLLVALSISHPVDGALLVAVGLFAWLIVFTITYSIPLVDGALSLMPMTVAAASLALGKIPAAWATTAGIFLHAGVRRWRADHSRSSQEPYGWDLVEATAINLLMHVLGILAAGVIYDLLGGSIPLTTLSPSIWLRLTATFAAYLLINYLLAAFYIWMRSPDGVRDYVKALPRLIFVALLDFAW